MFHAWWDPNMGDRSYQDQDRRNADERPLQRVVNTHDAREGTTIGDDHIVPAQMRFGEFEHNNHMLTMKNSEMIGYSHMRGIVP